jgi:uncharacterized cupin superfamily protein
MPIDDSILERSIRLAGHVVLNPAPIYADWVIEGNPIARNKVLSSSADGTASTLIWDCTAGRFNWIYDIDETIYVIEGGVVIRDAATGLQRRYNAGDSIFFPAGARAEWHVEKYIRKIAFCRAPLPASLVFFKRGFRFLKRRLMGSSPSPNGAPAMFQGR